LIDLAIPVEVLAGIALALAEIGLKGWRSRRRFKRRHADVVEQWRSVSRQTCKSLKAAVRGRRPIQPHQAALVIDFIDRGEKLRRARSLKRRKGSARVLALNVVFLAVAAYAISTGDSVLGSLGVGLAGYYGAVIILVLVYLIRARRWNRQWRDRAIDARAEAVRVLAEPPLSTS
jgi:hypothetical protein